MNSEREYDICPVRGLRTFVLNEKHNILLPLLPPKIKKYLEKIEVGKENPRILELCSLDSEL